ncbi:MAG: FAD-dependent pyridine nucleotide-disulfide oxidoreductase [Marmoricola sp.]|nr:FAD-dependent pyridine nucleotide-disulfide oxidoreductase [Marmoricola sp.]
MTAPIVVVGGGLAAGRAVRELRDSGYEDEIVVFAGEPEVPYERPPLSKGYLQGADTRESTYVQPREWYDEHDVDLRLDEPVQEVDLEAQTVRSSGGVTPFHRLLIATGARARTLDLASTESIDVRYLRTLADSTALKEHLGAGHHLMILGAGWIGMEVAASARTLGTTVTVVEPAELPLLAALGPEVAARFAAVHRAHGVDLRLGTGLGVLDGAAAVLSDGARVEPDTLLVGIGAIPNDELARAAGLTVDNGILVDEGLRTSHPAVFAAGDVANAHHPLLGTRIRVEHWQNAISQGRAAAHALLDEPVSYEDLPYFFSDQYDLGMEFFGHAAGADDVRLEPGDSDDAFSCWWRREGRLVAAMHVNEWDRSDELRERVASGA